MPPAGNDSQSFAEALQSHLEEWRYGVDGSMHRDWDHWADGIYPEYRELAEAAVRDDEVRLHRYASHLRSSQVFAFNLFLPFREGNREHLSRRVGKVIGADLAIEDVRFEWVPPGHILGELHGTGPLATRPRRGSTSSSGANCRMIPSARSSSRSS